MFDKKVLRNLSYGVYVVSTKYENKNTGCVANCAVQLTYNTVAVSLNHNNYTNEAVKKTGEFAISILPEDVDPNTIAIFGFSTGKDKNKFETVEYKEVNNLPVLLQSTGYLTLKTVKTVELETHTLFIGEITGGNVFNDKNPMTYKYYHEVLKGNAPKAAPTYIDPKETKILKDTGKKYRCKICGYIYEGDITKEGPNYVCPVCKQPVSVFEEIMLA